MDPSTPGETATPPVADDQSGQSAPQAPNGSETDINSGHESAMVPSDRLREETSKRREAEARAEELERKLAEQSQNNKPSEDEDEEIDPNVEKLVTKIIDKRGYVKKEDLDARDGQRQYNEDVAELTSKYAKTSVPFDAQAIRDYAKQNGLNITNKTALEAAYKQMNFDKILEAAKNSAITDFKEGRTTEGEKPGSSGGKPEDTKPEVRGLKNRVHAAASRIS